MRGGRSARIAAVLLASLVATGEARGEVAWRALEPGLALAVIDAPVKSSVGNSKITVVRVDPRRFRFRLLTAEELGLEPMPAHDWARRYGLVAALNAGMFQLDHRTSVGFMTNRGHVNNPRLTPDFNLVLAFNRRGAEVPAIQIIDIKCQDFAKLRRRYETMVQSLRMADCKGRNRWGVSYKKWSTVAIGQARDGKMLLIHTRSPYPVHTLVAMLLKLPLKLRTLMYLEGGPEATLYLNAGGVRFEKVGSYETGFHENDSNTDAWALPNVIGVVRRKAAH